MGGSPFLFHPGKFYSHTIPLSSSQPSYPAYQQDTASNQIIINSIYSLLLSTPPMNIDPVFASPCDPSSAQPSSPVICSSFSLFSQGQGQTQIQALLYDKSIVLKNRNEHSSVIVQVIFDFQLCFELLRDKVAEKRKYNLDEVYSIKFTRKEKKFELRNPEDPLHFSIWRDHLSKHLNQGGFHQIFTPIKEIGRGAFASVYLVRSNEDQQPRAIKAFSKDALRGEENGMKALVNEIAIMRMFNHKNLMKIQGVYESQNSLYICVELLSGGQLLDKLKSKYKFSSQEIRAITKGILSGLEAMHNMNIMHRDLKPENILFRDSTSLECVIADFGLAESSLNELMFLRCGTPGYVAPEIVNLKSSKGSYSNVCDLFSLGVIFHMMVLGRPPFPGKTYDQVLEQNKSCKINFDSFDYDRLPPSHLSLLKGLLEKDPKKRLTASQALAHEFFKKEPLITRNIDKLKENKQPSLTNSINVFLPPSTPKKTSIECSSPLMLTKSAARKAAPLRDDSCLKFKMKEAVMTGRIEQGKQVFSINSPYLKERNAGRANESRFKQMADHS